MLLYQTPGGVWTGTQKDHKAAMAAEGLNGKDGIEGVDVPVSPKSELLKWLNLHARNDVTQPVAEREASEAGAQEGLADESRAPSTGPIDRIAVEELIANADFPTAVSFSEHTLLRLAEHVGEAKELCGEA